MTKVTVRLLFILSLIHLSLNGLSQSPEVYERYGDDAVESRNAWPEAFGYYLQAYELDSTSSILRQKLAHAAREVKDYPLALRLYRQSYGSDEGKSDPDALFYIARLEKMLGRYEDAQRNFKKYTKKYKATADRKLMAVATHEVKSSQWALEHVSKHENPDSLFAALVDTGFAKVDWKFNRLPETIVRAESELAPFQSLQTFYFSEYVDGKWRIRAADVLSDSVQSESNLPVYANIREVQGLPASEGGQANFSQVGDRIYFSQINDGFTQLMTGSWDGDHIVSAYVMDILNDEGTVNTMPHFAVINGKDYLFFVSNRSGGEGGLDIWYSVDDNGWKKPKNAGKRINSEGDEVSPFYHNGHLFFSSDWHNGFGGFDIFYANRKGESFDKPVNMGTTINSSYNDLSPAVFVSQAMGRCDFYYASNKPQQNASGMTCCNDLYVATAIMQRAMERSDTIQSVLNALMSELPVVLYFHNDEPNPKSTSPSTQIRYDETFNSYLSRKEDYVRENSRGLSEEKREDGAQRTLDFFELKVEKGMNDLKRFSDALFSELNDGLSFRIYVRGFASPRANSDYNLNLTKRRTMSLLNYFRATRDGSFLPFLENTSANGARLEIVMLPFGEVKSDNTVSDDLVDERESIYSRAASLERRIEIEEVVVLAPPVRRAVPELSETRYDFGVISPGASAEHEFILTNSGNIEMTIDSVFVPCDCISAKLNSSRIAPGDSTTLIIQIAPKQPGEFRQDVMIHIVGEKPAVIQLSGERAE
jgi:tetratricopeptide (TPR) repeat protein